MTTTTLDRRDIRVMVADLAGAHAKVALPGVAVFELATLPLPENSRTAAAPDTVVVSCKGCGGGCSTGG
ncbi:MAG TPA: hypothetical protein VGS19_20535 [Streptosporangiaceae bacterium]|nr:hypothetical protein [Streptosporangiaceae bacterium]